MFLDSGYMMSYEGRDIQITIIDTLEDFERLKPQLVLDKNYIYYIKDIRAYVYLNRVIASGDFRFVEREKGDLGPRTWFKNKNKNEIKEVKSDLKIDEVESMDTNETVMELSVPTIDELDNYFSSITLDYWR
jgi:hypothetical protein